MRILLVNRNHFVDGGADRVYLNTGKLLEDNGHEVAYLSRISENNLDSKQADYFITDIKTRSGSVYSKFSGAGKYLYNKEAAFNITKLIVDFKPDVAHIHLFYGVLSWKIKLPSS